MTSRIFRSSGLAAIVCAAAAFTACHSDQTNSAGCPNDQYCINLHDGDDRWFCDTTQSPPQCSEAARECDTASDCCPSQICNLQGHFCADKFTSCTGPGSCPAPGEICTTIGVRPSGLGCTYNKCSAAGTCADASTVCFNGYCVGSPPCNGGCPQLDGMDQVCVTATDYCSPSPKDSGGTCERTCPTGQMLVLHDPNNIFDTCDLATETCDCIELPPLVVHDVARHSSLATYGTSLYVSAYDGEYGDLVMATYDKSNLATPTSRVWLDGVPANCTALGGDPNGPRGGCTTPGPDVGEYTSIAADGAGNVFISYYDVDNGDLKFIARYGGPNAAWTTPITLDGSSTATPPAMTGDVGLYSSIALTVENVPAIAYFQRASVNNNTTPPTETGNTTQLLYIVANKPQPILRSDWSAPIVVETLNRVVPCGGSCSASQVCVSDPNATNGQRCAAPAATCTPACTGTNTCVLGTDANQTPECLGSLQGQVQTDLPQGTGLMPSLKFGGASSGSLQDIPVIAYYDSINQELKAVIGANPATNGSLTTPGFGAPVILDGNDPAPAVHRDTGRYPSLAIGTTATTGGRIAIAFQDRTSQQLLLYQADSLIAHALHDVGSTVNNIHLIDNGVPAAGATWHPQTFPGVQSGIAFTPSGKIALAYQDGTLVDMTFAQWDPVAHAVAGTAAVLHGNDGVTAAGFYPRIVVDSSGTAYMSSAIIKAATALQSANMLTVDSHAAP